jgi:hypothetical protein
MPLPSGFTVSFEASMGRLLRRAATRIASRASTAISRSVESEACPAAPAARGRRSASNTA